MQDPEFKVQYGKEKKETNPIIFNNIEKLKRVITYKIGNIYKGKYGIISYMKNLKSKVKHMETMKVIEGV